MPKTVINTKKLNDAILKSLGDSKAQDIVSIDLKGKSDICDFMIIASGTSDRHTVSVAEKLAYHLKHGEAEPIEFAQEGMREGKWVLIDLVSIAVHIFHPETREIYDLETLWSTPNKRKTDEEKTSS